MGLDVIAYGKMRKIDEGDAKDNSIFISSIQYKEQEKWFLGYFDPIKPGFYSVEKIKHKYISSYSTYDSFIFLIANLRNHEKLSYSEIYQNMQDYWNSKDDYAWNHINQESISTSFDELIKFGGVDGDGILGTTICKKLLKDFKNHKDILDEFSVYNESNDDHTTKIHPICMRQFKQIYDNFISLLEVAKDDGCIVLY